MNKFFVVGFLLFASTAWSQVLRFRPDQVAFFLQDNSENSQACEHKLLPQVPWWSVVCGRRQYTVNTWAQVSHNRVENLTKVTLMYDVSEGTASSGHKLVQFHSHFTDVYVSSLTQLRLLSSSLDVANGQFDLVMRVRL